jgi:hypothetical protein
MNSDDGLCPSPDRDFRVRTLPALITGVSGKKTRKIDTSIILSGGLGSRLRWCWGLITLGA